MKEIVPWLLLIVAVLVIFTQCQRKPETVTNTITEIDTLVVVDTVRVAVYRDNVISSIDTVYVDEHEYTVAKYKETIDTLNVTVDLDIEYWEQDRYFNVLTDISTEFDTVYITETNTVVKEKGYPAISAIMGLSPVFENKEGATVANSFMADAGIRLFGKYDISIFATTNSLFGVRAGIKF